MSSVIYFLQDIKIKNIRMWITTDLEKDIERYTGWYLGNLKLLATLPGNDEKLLELQKRFADSRKSVQWFKPGEELTKYIKSIAG